MRTPRALGNRGQQEDDSMKDKARVYRNGASVHMEKLFPSGMYRIYSRGADGEMLDNIRVDDYSDARHYYKAFGLVAKNS